MAPYTDTPGFWGPATSTIDWCEENYEVGVESMISFAGAERNDRKCCSRLAGT